MGKGKLDRISEFNLEGRFLGFAAKDGYKLKYLRLATATGEYTLKIPKEARLQLYRTLTPGVWVQVSGYRKLDPEAGRVKLKAYQVTPIAPGEAQLPATEPLSAIAEPTSPSPKATILVCQKSDCCKRGGSALFRALQAELDDRGLAGQVTLKPTGCMKRCKAGPNLVMPDKTRYSQIRSDAVSDLLDKHFPVPVQRC